MVTVIRHQVTHDGFAVVVTTTHNGQFLAVYQRYQGLGRGHFTLITEEVFGDEHSADICFNHYHKSEI